MILFPDNAGDILLATPLIRSLKTQVADSYIYAALPASKSWVLQGNPNVDEIIPYSDKPDELIDGVRDLMPDYFIDLEGKRLYRRLKRKTKIFDFCIGRVPKGSENLRERLFRVADVFDIQDDQGGLDFAPSAFNPDWLPEKFLSGFAALALEPSESQPMMEEEQLIELVSLVEKPTVVIGGANTRKLAESIGQRTGCTVFPVCGDFSESEMAAIISACRVLVSYDNLWHQIGTAIGKPVIKIGLQDTQTLPETATWIRQWFT
jgi:ADP-heptose:LPS heptosyltransferase